MTASRIMTTNYIEPDIVSNAYVSSEQAAFPVANLYNRQRRSKVWRSNGYWNVTADNNTLLFASLSGGSLLAEIAIAEYTSTASFMAAVETALDTADGTYTYTVTQDGTTGKITIAQDVVGGGQTFAIALDDPQSEGFAELTGFATTSTVSGLLTYTADQLRIHSSEWILWDCGISTNPQAFILVGPRNTPIKITPSAVIKLQGNETNIWDDPSYEHTVAYDDEAMILADSEGLHTEALRFWRLHIEDKENPNLYVEIGAVFLGAMFEPARGAVQFPFSAAYVDRSNTVFSAGGQTFSDIRQKTEQLQLNWRQLTVSEKEEIDEIFADVGTSLPFFVQLDPDLDFSTRASKYVRYCKFDSPPSYDLETPGNFSCAMTLREEL